MTDRKMTTVQCFEDSKRVIDEAAEKLRWTLPLVVELLAEALTVMTADEPTVEERKAQMLARLGGTNVRQKSNKSLTAISQESHNVPALTEVAS